MALKLSWTEVILLVIGLLFSISAHSQDQSGFITIDCGLSKEDNYTDERTSLYYVSDEGFVETGTNMDISPIFLSAYPKRLRNLRSFPQGIKNCYTLRPAKGKGTNYLVRVTFMYGNYDSRNKTPEFDLHIGTDLWFTVKFNTTFEGIEKEIIYTPSADYFYICLVNIGLGTPFISLLEIRHLGSSIYNRFSGSLELLGRFYTDTRATVGIRYKDDIFDRIWQPGSLANSTTISTTLVLDTSDSPFRLPSLAMQAATTMKNKNDPMVIPLCSLVPVNGNSTSLFHICLHFAELVKLSANEIREFNMYLNGELITDPPYSPTYLDAQTYCSFDALTGDGITVRLEKTARSTLAPIINALEYFMVKQLFQALTNQEDVHAISGVKSAYSLSKNWQGDPCVPQSYMWDGVNCSFTNLNSIIITLDLSSSGLTGKIASSFSNLTALQVLDLSNNSLTGEIPESLARLPSLRVLNLSINKLTGSVPEALMKKVAKGQLTLSLSGNPDLCLSSTCAKRKKKGIIAFVVASICAFIGLAVLVILLVIKTRKAAKPKTATYNHNNRGIARYSYSEVIDLTKGFERKLGKGGFGVVYYGCLKDGTEVAVKKLYFTAHGLEQFDTEIELLMTICHKNLVCLLGYCNEGENLVLIYEYMVNGDLQKVLSANEAQSWKKRLNIAIGAAQGLDYLHHGCRPPIVHRDVKTSNILLNENLEAKMADFGLSKIFPDDLKSHVSTRVMGTPGYLDPEYLITEQLNEKSDVYSFGVVLLELMTGQQSIIKSVTGRVSLVDKVRPLVETWDVWSIVDQRIKDDIRNQSSIWRLVDVAMSCVKRRSSERPTMGQVVTDLKECLAMETDDATSKGSNDRASEYK